MTKTPYTVTLVSSQADILPDLWEACFPKPLEGRWWYETLEQCGLEEQFTFFYAVLAQDGVATGIAPAFIMNVPIELVVPPAVLPAFRLLGKLIPSTQYERTLFIGSPCSDEGAIGLLASVDRARALEALHDAFAQKAKQAKAAMLVWKDFPSAMAADFEALSKRHGLFRVVSFPGAVVDLPHGNKDAYYAAMKASRRQKIKRKLRRSEATVSLDMSHLQKPDDATLHEIFALFTQTYNKATTKFEKLNIDFFRLIAQYDLTHFIVLREQKSGQMVAFMLCFALGDVVINKFIGIDYTRPKDWVLYFRLWDAAVDWALARGFTSIQSGQTGYSAKIELGHRLVPLTNYCKHRNPLVHAIYRTVAKGIDWHTLDDDLAQHLKAHPEVKAGL